MHEEQKNVLQLQNSNLKLNIFLFNFTKSQGEPETAGTCVGITFKALFYFLISKKRKKWVSYYPLLEVMA